MATEREREWSDRRDDEDVYDPGGEDAYFPTYRDGSPQNECWSEYGITRPPIRPDVPGKRGAAEDEAYDP